MTSTKTKPAPKHKEGSRKSKVHALFDSEGGPDAAWTLGLKLKLSPNTLRSWFATWRRETQAAKKKTAAAKAAPSKNPPSKTIKTAITTPPEPVELIPVFLNG